MTQSGRLRWRSWNWKSKALGRQAVAHDRLHAPLPEGAAALLVGEDVLEGDHFLRHRRHARLRRVHHREAFFQLRQRRAGLGGIRLQPLADIGADMIEPLGHQL